MGKSIANYRLGAQIGSGSFGHVYLATHQQTGHRVALKIVSKSRLDRLDLVRREIATLQMLTKHPNIVSLYEILEDSGTLILVTEYADGGELYNHIVSQGLLTEDVAKQYVRQIISAVQHCHRAFVVHRDLKLENIMLDFSSNPLGDVKIADFGLANILSEGELLQTPCGSPNYAAPEVISGRSYAGPAVDAWSIGVITYAILCGRLPFDDESVPNLFAKIRRGTYAHPPNVSAEAADFVAKLLVPDATHRMTLPQARHHPWLGPANAWDAALTAPFASSLSLPTLTPTDPATIAELERIGFDCTSLDADRKAGRVTETTVAAALLTDMGPERGRHMRLGCAPVGGESADAAAAAGETEGVDGRVRGLSHGHIFEGARFSTFIDAASVRIDEPGSPSEELASQTGESVPLARSSSAATFDRRAARRDSLSMLQGDDRQGLWQPDDRHGLCFVGTPPLSPPLTSTPVVIHEDEVDVAAVVAPRQPRCYRLGARFSSPTAAQAMQTLYGALTTCGLAFARGADMLPALQQVSQLMPDSPLPNCMRRATQVVSPGQTPAQPAEVRPVAPRATASARDPFTCLVMCDPSRTVTQESARLIFCATLYRAPGYNSGNYVADFRLVAGNIALFLQTAAELVDTLHHCQ